MRYDFPANPVSVDPDVGCPEWQQHSTDAEQVMCSPTIAARIDGVPACGWCTEAYQRGAA